MTVQNWRWRGNYSVICWSFYVHWLPLYIVTLIIHYKPCTPTGTYSIILCQSLGDFTFIYFFIWVFKGINFNLKPSLERLYLLLAPAGRTAKSTFPVQKWTQMQNIRQVEATKSKPIPLKHKNWGSRHKKTKPIIWQEEHGQEYWWDSSTQRKQPDNWKGENTRSKCRRDEWTEHWCEKKTHRQETQHDTWNDYWQTQGPRHFYPERFIVFFSFIHSHTNASELQGTVLTTRSGWGSSFTVWTGGAGHRTAEPAISGQLAPRYAAYCRLPHPEVLGSPPMGYTLPVSWFSGLQLS